ncbi:unnamed protein product [Prunus armeniaca]
MERGALRPRGDLTTASLGRVFYGLRPRPSILRSRGREDFAFEGEMLDEMVGARAAEKSLQSVHDRDLLGTNRGAFSKKVAEVFSSKAMVHFQKCGLSAFAKRVAEVFSSKAVVPFQKCSRCFFFKSHGAVFFKGHGAFSKIWSGASLCKSSRAFPCKSGRMLPSQKVGPGTP